MQKNLVKLLKESTTKNHVNKGIWMNKKYFQVVSPMIHYPHNAEFGLEVSMKSTKTW